MSSPPVLSIDSEYSDLVHKLSNEVSPSYSSLEYFFYFLQLHHIRNSPLTVKYGNILIDKYSSELKLNLYDIYEKVLLACCDIGDDINSERILNILALKFGVESIRVNRLRAYRLESMGKYDIANEVYNNILIKDPTNIHCLKRQISIAKARNQIDLQVKLLNKYLKTFNSDESAWIELAEAYQTQLAVELVAFCYEELILLSPENYLYHLQLADAYYATNKIELARQYYSQSLELKPNNNLRALYGLINALRSSNKVMGGSQQLYSWALEKLFRHYEAYNPDYIPIIKQSLETSNSSNSITSSNSDTKAGEIKEIEPVVDAST